MDPLYLLDRLVTRAFQWLGRLLFTKLHMSLTLQYFAVMLFMFGMATVATTTFHLKANKWGIVLGYAFYCLFFFRNFLSGPLSDGLWKLHKFLDREAACREDKEYSDGYLAWGYLLICVLVLLIAMQMQKTSIGGESLVFQMCYWMSAAYVEFNLRKKGPPKNKKQYVSDSLRALLERCRDWLPAPQGA